MTNTRQGTRRDPVKQEGYPCPGRMVKTVAGGWRVQTVLVQAPRIKNRVDLIPIPRQALLGVEQ